jgi:N-acetylneuraminic acid mutarotase
VTTQLNNLLTQRQDSQMARVGQWVLIWGGENASGPLGDGVRLDLANGYSHVMTPAGPEARTRFSMTVVGDKIAIWGGEGLNGDLNNGALYEPASNTWTSMAASASVPGRHGHQVYASGTELVFVGGESQGQPVGAIDAYSTATSTWRKVESNVSLPFYPAAHVQSSKLFLVTGRQSGGGMNQALVEIDLTPNLYYYRKP